MSPDRLHDKASAEGSGGASPKLQREDLQEEGQVGGGGVQLHCRLGNTGGNVNSATVNTRNIAACSSEALHRYLFCAAPLA